MLMSMWKQPRVDRAVEHIDAVQGFLRQGMEEHCPWEDTLGISIDWQRPQGIADGGRSCANLSFLIGEGGNSRRNRKRAELPIGPAPKGVLNQRRRLSQIMKNSKTP